MFGWVTALIFAVPMWRLARAIFAGPAEVGIFGSGTDQRTTFWSLIVALALAAPSVSQLSYLLEHALTLPVLSSAVGWALFVEVVRTTAIRLPSGPASDRIGRLAVGLAGVIALPKLVLLAVRLGG